MAENNNGTQKRGGLINKIIGAAVLLIVVLLIIFIGPKGDKTPDGAADDANTNADDSALHVVQPVKAGDYEYAFSGVKWTFDTTSPEVAGTDQTWLKLEFADFTRNGNAIAFGRPYKLGVHAGTCKEVDFIDTESLEGIPFSYAECEGAGVKQEFVVLQQLEKVVVMMNETKAPSTGSGQAVISGWKDWYSINVTEIVR